MSGKFGPLTALKLNQITFNTDEEILPVDCCGQADRARGNYIEHGISHVLLGKKPAKPAGDRRTVSMHYAGSAIFRWLPRYSARSTGCFVCFRADRSHLWLTRFQNSWHDSHKG